MIEMRRKTAKAACDPADLTEAGQASERLDAPSLGASELDQMQFEVALYVENISAELRAMTQAVKLDSLSYFLEMARVEASLQVEQQALARSKT